MDGACCSAHGVILLDRGFRLTRVCACVHATRASRITRPAAKVDGRVFKYPGDVQAQDARTCPDDKKYNFTRPSSIKLTWVFEAAEFLAQSCFSNGDDLLIG